MKEENIYLACGRGFEAVIRFVVNSIKWLFSKYTLLLLSLIAALIAGIYYDPTGFFKTWILQVNHLLNQLVWGLSGLAVSLIVLYVLIRIESVRKLVFPFLDELDDMADAWREGKTTKQGDGELAIAFAICTAGVAIAIFYLIANMGTPLG